MTTDLLFTRSHGCGPRDANAGGPLTCPGGPRIWFPVSEQDEALVQQVLDRTWAFHGRIASREQIQVEITFPQRKVWLDLFLRWWEYGFRSWRKRAGADAFSLSHASLVRGPMPLLIVRVTIPPTAGRKLCSSSP